MQAKCSLSCRISFIFEFYQSKGLVFLAFYIPFNYGEVPLTEDKSFSPPFPVVALSLSLSNCHSAFSQLTLISLY